MLENIFLHRYLMILREGIYLDKEIDLSKLVDSMIKYPRNCEHKKTHSWCPISMKLS